MFSHKPFHLIPARLAATLIGFVGINVHAEVVLNEVLASTTSTDTEYVELFNTAATPVDIGGWSIELWDSDAGSSFGGADGGSPYELPAGAAISGNNFFLLANSETEALFPGVVPDFSLPANAIENSSFTIVLRDDTGNLVNSVFVTDGGTDDAANIEGNLITPDSTIGPNGNFLPAGFFRIPDGGDELAQLEFSPRPAPSGTPTGSMVDTGPGDIAQLATIPEIQGAGHLSVFVDVLVETSGVVTATDSSGFYLQDVNGDSDDATSDGIFVFTGSPPTVAVLDLVTLTGTVSEFTPGGAATRNLSTTQISGNLEIEITGSATELPAPIIVGAAGRIAPNQVIDDDAFTLFEPELDGIDFFESLEAMRVLIPDAIAVSPTSRFGEIFTVADQGSQATGLSNRGTLNIAIDDFNPEKVQIDEDTGILPGFELPEVDIGAQLGDVVGVVGYGFGNFEVYPTQAFTVVNSTLNPETTSVTSAGNRLSVASYNVLNLDPNPDDGDDDAGNGRFDTIAAHIVGNLGAPDIVGLQEIQDSDGAANTDVTDANVTLQMLVDAVASAGGPTYEFFDTPGLVRESVGGQPGGNIRVAFLYNPERVKSLGEATPLTDPLDQAENPDNPFFGSRISLAATFDFNGEQVVVVNNHLSSKGGSAPILGTEQPFDTRQEEPSVNGSLDERQRQATAVATYVNSILSDKPSTRVVVLGDFNEFEFVSPLNSILSATLFNATETLDENERYTFNFQGNSQSLDHILLSDSEDAIFDAVHVNSEFIESPSRASDHDPLIVSLRIDRLGDLDSDGDIDRQDRRLFFRAFGSRVGSKRYIEAADFNNNGRIDFRDFITFWFLYRDFWFSRHY